MDVRKWCPTLNLDRNSSGGYTVGLISRASDCWAFARAETTSSNPAVATRRTSISLSGRSSPRATDPKMKATRILPASGARAERRASPAPIVLVTKPLRSAKIGLLSFAWKYTWLPRTVLRMTPAAASNLNSRWTAPSPELVDRAICRR